MSDSHNNHGHGDNVTGHELDSPPTSQLFNIVWGLGALTLLSIVTCVQLFNGQRDALQSERLEASSYRLAEYRADQAKLANENGETDLVDDGKTYAMEHVPLLRAKEKVLADPGLLKAGPRPPGWVHPDDLAAGVQGAGSAAPTPAPAEGAAKPEGTEAAGTEAAGTEAAKPEGTEAAKPEGAEAAKPEGAEASKPAGSPPAHPAGHEGAHAEPKAP
ncbi:MAG: hypothetical protein R3B09_16930 [Nannocystaceae bacterium]